MLKLLLLILLCALGVWLWRSLAPGRRDAAAPRRDVAGRRVVEAEFEVEEGDGNEDGDPPRAGTA